MTRDQLQRLEGLFGEMQLVLRDALEHTHTKLRTCSGLLEHAPSSMAELPAWFSTLTREQLDAVWVTAIVECATNRGVSIRDLAMALLAVRHWPQGLIVPVGLQLPAPEKDREQPPTAVVTRRETTKPAGNTPRPASVDPTPKAARLLDRLRSAIPRAGDTVVLADAFPELNGRNYVATLAAQHPHEFRLHMGTKPGYHKPVRIVTRLTGVPDPTTQIAEPQTAENSAGAQA